MATQWLTLLYLDNEGLDQVRAHGVILMITKAKHRWQMLSLAWLCHFSFGMISTSIAPFALTISNDLELTNAQMGVIMGSWPLIYVASAVIEGTFVDRVGIRKSIALGVLVVSFSALLRSFAFDFVTLFGSVAVFGLGGPMISIGSPKLIATWFIGKDRGAAAGIYQTGGPTGQSFALAATIAVFFPLVGSWQNVFRLYATGAALVAFIWYIMSRDSPESIQENRRDERVSRTQVMSQIMKNRGMWLIVILGFAVFTCRHGMNNWLPRMLELRGMASAEAGFLASVPTITGIIGSIIVTTFATRLRSTKPLIIILFAAGGASIFLQEISTGSILFVSLASYGFFSGALLSLTIFVLMCLRGIGEKRMGTAVGLYYTIAQIGGFLGPALIGYLKDSTGSFFVSMVMLSLLFEAMVMPTLALDEQRLTSPV